MEKIEFSDKKESYEYRENNGIIKRTNSGWFQNYSLQYYISKDNGETFKILIKKRLPFANTLSNGKSGYFNKNIF